MSGLARLFLVPVIAFGLLLGSASSTLAHYVYQEGMVFVNPGANCTYSYSEISHGHGGGYSKVKTGSKTYYEPWGADCLADLNRPAGYMRTQIDLYKFLGGSSWGLCRRVDWVYNPSLTWIYTVETYHGSDAPCGAGTYRTEGHSYVNLNGSWDGGWLNSGNHDLPAY